MTTAGTDRATRDRLARETKSWAMRPMTTAARPTASCQGTWHSVTRRMRPVLAAAPTTAASAAARAPALNSMANP